MTLDTMLKFYLGDRGGLGGWVGVGWGGVGCFFAAVARYVIKTLLIQSFYMYDYFSRQKPFLSAAVYQTNFMLNF